MFSASGMRSEKVMANAFKAGFHRMAHRVCPVHLGSSDRTTRYRVFMADCSLGKCPRARTARRNRALSDSIALVPGMKADGGPRVVSLARPWCRALRCDRPEQGFFWETGWQPL